MAGVVALKACITAQTASFRYPRIQVGRLPTFDMPPPATVYGLLAAAWGDWFSPDGLQFSFVFEHAGYADDVETIHPIEKGSGRKTLLRSKDWDYVVNVQCSPNVQRRQFLLKPRLTLYLLASEARLSDWEKALISPYFALLLGRSQDLASCHSAERVELATSPEAFFENTLLPWEEWRPYVSPGASVVLPSATDYTRGRITVQERYLQITRPALWTQSTGDVSDRRKLPSEFLVDSSDTRQFLGEPVPRGLHFWPVRGPVAAR